MSLQLLDIQTRVAPGEFFPQLGGGGGGPSGPNLVASTLTVSSILGGGPSQSLTFPNGLSIPGGSAIAFGAKPVAGDDITFTGNQGSLLGVSTINGSAYPPAGSGVFQSTFSAVSCPSNASTVLMELTPGQWGFSGIGTLPSATDYLAGFVSVLSNATAGVNYGNLVTNTCNQPSALPVVLPTLNFGDSGLSTIKLIVANTASSNATFTGIVSKLY